MTDVVAAARYLESQFANAVTLTFDVGYNEVGGDSLDGGALGESLSNLNTVEQPPATEVDHKRAAG